MPIETFLPAVADAVGLAFEPLEAQCEPVSPPLPRYSDAGNYYKPIVDELLGCMHGALAEADVLQAYTCASGDAVDDAVQLTGSLTVAKALGTVNAPVIGFIRHKGPLEAASVASSTTCYLIPFLKKTGLTGGAAGAPCYLSDSGGFGADPGSVRIRVGTFISSSVALLFSSPLGTGVPSYDELDPYTRAGVALAHTNNPAALMYAFQNFS